MNQRRKLVEKLLEIIDTPESYATFSESVPILEHCAFSLSQPVRAGVPVALRGDFKTFHRLQFSNIFLGWRIIRGIRGLDLMFDHEL